VVITDKTITPAEINLEANRRNLLGKNITVAQFEWGKDPSHLKPPFDVILAADVIYIEDTFPLLLQSLVNLSNRETVILLSCKRRYERDDRFFDLLRESGRFSHSVVWQWPKEHAQELENDVKVYEIRLAS
jgi:predicted nicotinamide N-methyase